MSELGRSICVDIGYGFVRGGFVGRDSPRAVFPTIIGKIKFKQLLLPGMKSVYVGDEANSKKGILRLSKPMDPDGIVNNWEDMEYLFQYLYDNEFRVNSEDQAIIMGEGCFNPKGNRRKMAELMFEKFNVPLMNSCPNALLVLIGSGRMSGVVLDCGEGISSSVPIFEGCIIRNGARKSELAGALLTEAMIKLVQGAGYGFTGCNDKSLMQHMKENICHVAVDFTKELNEKNTKKYELPNGETISIGDECIKCPEVLFDPSIIGNESEGIHQMMYDSINSNTDSIMKKDFFSNIVLAGGSTNFEGFPERISKEIEIMNNSTPRHIVKVVPHPGRSYSAWIGANILGSLSSFDKTWITRPEYDEFGCGIINRKTCY